MRGWLPVALVVLGIAAFLTYGSLLGPHSRAHIDPSSRPDFAPGVVDTVSDGDTIHLADGRRVRLVQIDAPELAGRSAMRRRRRGAREARATRRPVTLRHDPVLESRDRFGRVLAYVFKGGTNLNVAPRRARSRGAVLLRRRPWPLRDGSARRGARCEAGTSRSLEGVPADTTRPAAPGRHAPLIGRVRSARDGKSKRRVKPAI